MYDAIIIGAGQGGLPLSTALANSGQKTALVERNYLGGSCINYGCTPSKTLVASARVAHLVKSAEKYGIETGDVKVDMTQVHQRKQEKVESFRQSDQRRIEESDAELIRGTASFTGPKEIEVDLNEGGTRTLTGEKIFINTGARPRVPDVSGLQDVPYLNSTTLMDLEELPEDLVIIGGGYEAVEFGQMFRRFGSHVTIIQRAGQLLTQEDADVSDEIFKILSDDGIWIFLNAEPTEVFTENGNVQVNIDVADKEMDQAVSASHLLIAAGRVPNVEKLNLEAAGVELDERGTIKVNKKLETSAEGVYAIGDVKGGPAFTHISYDDFRVLRTNLLGDGGATVSDRPIPYTVFMDPELGRVGLTEKEAESQELDFKVAKMPANYAARAVETGETRGFIKALVDAENDQILGCAALVREGGEIMSMIQIAMMGEMPYTELRDGVFTHPTMAESLNTLFTQFS